MHIYVLYLINLARLVWRTAVSLKVMGSGEAGPIPCLSFFGHVNHVLV